MSDLVYYQLARLELTHWYEWVDVTSIAHPVQIEAELREDAVLHGEYIYFRMRGRKISMEIRRHGDRQLGANDGRLAYYERAVKGLDVSRISIHDASELMNNWVRDYIDAQGVTTSWRAKYVPEPASAE